MTKTQDLNDLLTYAYEALFWISEAPNRASGEIDGPTLELAEHARAALVHIERNDPAKPKATA